MLLSQLTSIYIVLIILWLLYFSIHSLFASLKFKQLILHAYPWFMPWYRLSFNLLAIVLLIPPVVLMFSVPGQSCLAMDGNFSLSLQTHWHCWH